MTFTIFVCYESSLMMVKSSQNDRVCDKCFVQAENYIAKKYQIFSSDLIIFSTLASLYTVPVFFKLANSIKLKSKLMST